MLPSDKIITNENPLLVFGKSYEFTRNSLKQVFLRAARLQNQTTPEKVLIRYEKGFEQREKR